MIAGVKRYMVEGSIFRRWLFWVTFGEGWEGKTGGEMAQMAQGRGKYKADQAADQQEAVIESLLDGCSRAAACRAATLPRRTFYNWLDSDPAFAARVAQAEERAVETMESVIYAAGLKSEDDPRYLRAAIRWLEQHGGWQRSNVNWNFDLTQCTDEELERIVHGEDPWGVLAGTRARRAAAEAEAGD